MCSKFVKPINLVSFGSIFSLKPHKAQRPNIEAMTNKNRDAEKTQMYPPESKRSDPTGYDIGCDTLQHRLTAPSLIILSLTLYRNKVKQYE